jgi:DNA-binding transcriptional MerR regulator
MVNALPAQDQKTYAIQEVSNRSGLSIPTLRYYEEMGLIPVVPRDKSSGHRQYTTDTLELVEQLAHLRLIGLSLAEMRSYAHLREQGNETAAETRELLKAHAVEIGNEISRLQKRQHYLSLKIAYWDAQVRGDLDEAERIVAEAHRVVKEIQ